uniref:J domain-containing protein n=1 Tax=Syphacia muris TaxID=451379 RepID=A0A0N5A8A2_9BILA
MGRAQFEYDEVGNTFYYVVLSFYALALLPATYLFWPSSNKEKKPKKEEHCNCEGCIEKRRKAEALLPWRRTKKILSIVALIFAWLIFFAIIYKVMHIEKDHVEYDPYSILGLDQGASVAQVKRQYRLLSKTLHPDKGGDPIAFDKIAKAYQALTDEESRENWEKYGNPDGPTATTFGIALPKWIVSSEYGGWVLAFYVILFMLVLPIAVGIWWYNSIKYSADQVLLDTTQLYFHFLDKTRKLEINRLIMVVGASFEFWKRCNKEIVERESDNIEIPPLIKEFKNLSENKKERPFCMPYAIKARLFIHAHLSRFELPSPSLRNDSSYVISKCVMLINEMLSIAQNLYFYGNPAHCPSLETIENLTKLSSMIVQALWPKNSTLLQLPHITEHNLHYLRKNKISNCGALANLHESKRRYILQSLTDGEYRDVINVLHSMPKLTIDTRFEVQGEDDAQEVTVGSVVTLKVKLVRSSLLDLTKRTEEMSEMGEKASEVNLVEEAKESVDEKENVSRRKVWEKPKKKSNKVKVNKNRQQQKGKIVKKVIQQNKDSESKPLITKDTATKDDETDKGYDESGSSDTEKNDEKEGDKGSCKSSNDDSSDSEEEYEWVKENIVKKEALLETKSRKTHAVHCPYYPCEKFEWWWLFLIDKKLKRIVLPGVHCTTLVDEQTVEIRFPAPQEKGIYYYTLLVKSDSYMDCDYSLDLKLDVLEAKDFPIIKYEDSEDEEQDDQSSDYTEDSDSDQD